MVVGATRQGLACTLSCMTLLPDITTDDIEEPPLCLDRSEVKMPNPSSAEGTGRGRDSYRKVMRALQG